MNIDNFLRPKLVGKRFEDHAIPMALLGDLAVIEAMVIEVAKWCYLKDNERQRVPAGFAKGVSLGLKAVEEGSAIAAIALLLPPTLPNVPAPQQVYCEMARDRIVNAISAADKDESPTAYLPQKGLAYFDRLGRNLQDGEAIEFSAPELGKSARLTKEVRRRLLRAAEVTERTEGINLRGGIFSTNQEEWTFVMMLPDGSKVSGPITKPHVDTILDANRDYLSGLKVCVEGIGKFSEFDKLKRIESVDHISLLAPLDVQAQIEELKVLKSGWLDGKGKALPADGLDWLIETFTANYPENLELPYIYPTADQGVMFEWQIGSWDVSMEFDIASHHADWHVLNLETKNQDSRRLELDNPDDWTWIIEQIGEMAVQIA